MLADNAAVASRRVFHFKKNTRLPNEIWKHGAFAGFLLDPVLKSSTGFFIAIVTKTDEQAVAEHLRFAFLIALQSSGISDKLRNAVRNLGHSRSFLIPRSHYEAAPCG